MVGCSVSSGGVGGLWKPASFDFSRGTLRELLRVVVAGAGGALNAGLLAEGGWSSRRGFGAVRRGSGCLGATAGPKWSRDAAGRSRGFLRPEFKPSREGEGRTAAAAAGGGGGGVAVDLGRGRRENRGIPLGLPGACFSSMTTTARVSYCSGSIRGVGRWLRRQLGTQNYQGGRCFLFVLCRSDRERGRRTDCRQCLSACASRPSDGRDGKLDVCCSSNADRELARAVQFPSLLCTSVTDMM